MDSLYRVWFLITSWPRLTDETGRDGTAEENKKAEGKRKEENRLNATIVWRGIPASGAAI